MAGFSDATELEILDHAMGVGAWTMPTGSFIQLHLSTGPTDADGTLNPAATTPRKAVTWSAASGGSITNSADIDWSTGETATETVTTFSLWDAVTAGNYIGSGDVNPDVSVTAGNALTIPAGNLTYTLD